MNNYPIWYWNYIRLFDWTFDKNDVRSYLGVLVMVTPNLNEYIDKTMVIGNPHAERVVKVFNRLFNRFAKFYTLTQQPEDSQTIITLIETHKRLNGLVKGMK